MREFELELSAQSFAVCRLDPESPLPKPVPGAPFWSLTRTGCECSLVVPEAEAPAGAKVEAGWRAFKLKGPIPFEETGVLYRLLEPLARAGVPIFAVSTYDTDYLFVPGIQLDNACQALRSAGIRLQRAEA